MRVMLRLILCLVFVSVWANAEAAVDVSPQPGLSDAALAELRAKATDGDAHQTIDGETTRKQPQAGVGKPATPDQPCGFMANQ